MCSVALLQIISLLL